MIDDRFANRGVRGDGRRLGHRGRLCEPAARRRRDGDRLRHRRRTGHHVRRGTVADAVAAVVAEHHRIDGVITADDPAPGSSAKPYESARRLLSPPRGRDTFLVSCGADVVMPIPPTR